MSPVLIVIIAASTLLGVNSSAPAATGAIFAEYVVCARAWPVGDGVDDYVCSTRRNCCGCPAADVAGSSSERYCCLSHTVLVHVTGNSESGRRGKSRSRDTGDSPSNKICVDEGLLAVGRRRLPT